MKNCILYPPPSSPHSPSSYYMPMIKLIFTSTVLTFSAVWGKELTSVYMLTIRANLSGQISKYTKIESKNVRIKKFPFRVTPYFSRLYIYAVWLEMKHNMSFNSTHLLYRLLQCINHITTESIQKFFLFKQMYTLKFRLSKGSLHERQLRAF